MAHPSAVGQRKRNKRESWSVVSLLYGRLKFYNQNLKQMKPNQRQLPNARDPFTSCKRNWFSRVLHTLGRFTYLFIYSFIWLALTLNALNGQIITRNLLFCSTNVCCAALPCIDLRVFLLDGLPFFVHAQPSLLLLVCVIQRAHSI